MRLSLTWSVSSAFAGLFPDYGQIAHLLRTRAPVAAKDIATLALPLDLHVLGLSLAFILSQDQTLRCKNNNRLSAQNNLLSVLIDGNNFFPILVLHQSIQSLKEHFLYLRPFSERNRLQKYGN